MQPDFHAPRMAHLACLMSSLVLFAACGGASGDASTETSAVVADADAMAQAARARRPAPAPAPAPTAPANQPPPGPGPAVTNFAVLTWTPPTGAVTGYRVYYGTTSRNYQQALGSGIYAAPSKETVVLNLTQGATYYFAVTAIDAAGQESAYSAEDTKLIP
jgi:hypothetical protein